jgi:hypothetical protein
MHKRELAAGEVIPQGVTGCRSSSLSIATIAFILKSCVSGSHPVPSQMLRKFNFLLLNSRLEERYNSL